MAGNDFLFWSGTPRHDRVSLASLIDSLQEFAVGLDVSSLVEGMVASTGWDEMVYVWRQDSDPRS